MTNNNCLNCEKELTDEYCSGCGQKADTHRITFKNFIFHDLLHGTFHIEKGMLFTAKQALRRPGKAALDYISGKRKPYYNVFLLVLLTIGLLLFIRHFYGSVINPEEEIVQELPKVSESTKKLDEVFSQKSKFIILLFIPFGALNSFILFRRKKLNLSEHSIIAGMILLGMLLIDLIGHILFFANLIIRCEAIISMLIAASILFYICYGYFNAFSTDYSKVGIAYRIVLFYGLICLEMMMLIYIFVGFVTNWKFGEVVTIAPFG